MSFVCTTMPRLAAQVGALATSCQNRPMTIAGEVLTVRGEAEFLARTGTASAPYVWSSCAAVDLRTWSLADARRRAAVGHPGPPEVVVRKLFTPRVLDDEDSRRHLDRIVAAGGQARVCTAALPRGTIVLDGRIAFLAGPSRGTARTVSVLREPDVVAGLRALFLAGREGATELSAYQAIPHPARGEYDRKIVALLSAGRTDETAARRLGLSVRTDRRRVAELMSLLGAESRFQDGTKARDAGL